MQPNIIDTVTSKPVFNPTYINLEYVFNKIYDFFHAIYNALFAANNTSTSTSSSQGISNFQGILILFCIFFIIIIIYCTVRIFEIRKQSRVVSSSA